MKYKFLNILLIVIFAYSLIFGQDKSVIYIMDNSFLGNNTKEYFLQLQNKLDNNFSLNPIPKYDINTTETLNILKRLKQNKSTVILKIGEANYYNLYGFAAYRRYRQKKIKNKVNSLRDINIEIAKQYGVLNNNFVDLVKHIGRQIFLSDTTKFVPKVIPNFYILNSDFDTKININSSITSYLYAWKLINENKFEQAKSFVMKLIAKQPNQSMFHYVLGSLYLITKEDNYQINALKCFEDGILVDVFNRNNLCYKGLVVMFMMYDGILVKDILYFSTLIERYMPNYSKDISAILSIGNVEYDDKIELINQWLLNDIEQIKQVCKDKNIDLILTTYPTDVRSEKIIKKYFHSDKTISYFNDKIKFNEDMHDWINRSVTNLSLTIKKEGM